MNLLILHLSDLHFDTQNNYQQENINAIVGALQQSMMNTEHILVVISGDLTHSGKKQQFIQVSIFIRNLRKALSERYKISDIQIAMVPGNHDVDYSLGEMRRGDLESLEMSGSYEANVRQELDKQAQFFTLSGFYDCFPRPSLFHQRTIPYGDKTIQLNLINTAAFSSLDEDQGFHYISEKDIETMLAPSESDFVITVMHHPHHWYSSCCKKAFEEALYSRSDIIFVGHEHYESSMKIEHENASVNIFAAGKLGDRGDWSDSEFHVAVLNLDTRAYTTRKYHWNGAAKIYEEKNKEEISISRDRYNQLGLIVRQEFSESLEEDKYFISRSVHDYFVFPLLIEDHNATERGKLPREIDSLDSLIQTMSPHEKIVIKGSSDSGKSVLAKAIYKELSSRQVSLFVNGANVGPNPERVIRNTFEETYSDERVDYEAFMQTKPEDLAIVIDDVDMIASEYEERFIKYVGEHFGIIIETCQSEIEVDIRSRLKKRASTRSFTIYSIAPFYANKRKELVSNIVKRISKSEPDDQERIIIMLCDVLTKQKHLYSWSPEFIVQFVKYYCNNIGEAAQNDGSVFSKVFEANLTQLIKPYARGITVDKVMMVLDKIAYGIYIDRTYPISLVAIDKYIQEYNRIYGSSIDTRNFVTLLLDAKIMKQTNSDYLFYDKNYLAYFIAREIKRHCLEEDDYTQFNHIVEYSNIELNANVLLFVTYITDNLRIIRMIMEQAICSVQHWDEFDLRAIDIPFLVNNVDQIVKPFEEGDKAEAEKERIKEEKAEAQSIAASDDSSIFSEESEELTFVQQVIKSISLMIILARTLPSFEHMMKKEDKEKCVDMLYRMPLKIFEAWALKTDEVSSELIADIKEFQEKEFRKEKAKAHPVDDKRALSILKWEATSLLLDLMDAVMNNATRENTNCFIDGFDYNAMPTYRLEHLIGLARRDNVAQFTSEAEKLYEDEKHPMTKIMVQRVARNYMVNSRRIKKTDTQRLNAKLFNERLPQNRILVEQKRNKAKQ